MKSIDATITKENPVEDIRRANQEAGLKVRQTELEASEAARERQELELKLQEAEAAAEKRDQEAENAGETERKINEVGGG